MRHSMFSRLEEVGAVRQGLAAAAAAEANLQTPLGALSATARKELSLRERMGSMGINA